MATSFKYIVGEFDYLKCKVCGFLFYSSFLLPERGGLWLWIIQVRHETKTNSSRAPEFVECDSSSLIYSRSWWWPCSRQQASRQIIAFTFTKAKTEDCGCTPPCAQGKQSDPCPARLVVEMVMNNYDLISFIASPQSSSSSGSSSKRPSWYAFTTGFSTFITPVFFNLYSVRIPHIS